MTPADLSRLESLAREATPGEWKTPAERPFLVNTDAVTMAECFGVDRLGAIANAAYIAAANPAAVLALIDEVRRLRAAGARVKGEAP